jgi:F0F1-type ATP synthase assembly protein I
MRVTGTWPGRVGASKLRATRQRSPTYPQYSLPGGVSYTGPVATSHGTFRVLGQLSTVGLSFVMALVLGFGGGYLIDGWLGTRPWCSFIGFFLGLAAGILNVYRVMQLVNREEAARSRPEMTSSQPSADSRDSHGSSDR